MAYNKERLNLIRNNQVVYVITKNGKVLFSYDTFFSCLTALSNITVSDKQNKYDMVVRPKVQLDAAAADTVAIEDAASASEGLSSL